jgi:hypothetical protein
MNEHIIEYLNYYIELDNPQYAVLLKGNWGCGKTFFIKNLKEKWIDSNEESDKINIQPLYISLNGIENIKTVNDKIRAEINPFLYSKGMQVAKKVLKGLLKSTVKLDLNFNDYETSAGNISINVDSIGIFEKRDNGIKGKKIIIFDDFERCKIPTDEIFGYINHFVEHCSCKVILVADEEKIKEKYNSDKSDSGVSYKDFKEKLIGQTFEVTSDIENAISHFIEESQNLYSNQDIAAHKNLIKSLFIASNLENLRVLKQSMLDFNRFTSFFEASIIKNSNYKEFIKNLLPYFIIVYAEYKTGNEKINNFQGFYFTDKEKEENLKIERKYSPILSENSIIDSGGVIQISMIIDYIEKGFIEPVELNNELKTTAFFRSDTEQDWEKLWGWRFLNDKEFKELRKRVWSTFYKGDINDTTILLHISGILINLINQNLLDKNSDFVVKKSMRIIETILKSKGSTSIRQNYGMFEGAWGKQYQSIETEEYKKLKNFLLDKIENKQLNESTSYLKSIFENISDTSFESIYAMFVEPTPDRRTVFENTAIFKPINGKLLGKKIKKMSSKAIYDFQLILHYRYYPEERYSNGRLEKYHKEDLRCLIELQNEIGHNQKKREILKNKTLNELNEELALIITKIKDID